MGSEPKPVEGDDVRRARIALSRASEARWAAEAVWMKACSRERAEQAALDALLKATGGSGVGAQETGGGDGT